MAPERTVRRPTRAIVCFVEENRHLIQQLLALRHSWLYVDCADTDIVVMGPQSVLDRLPDDLVKIEQQPVAEDPAWRNYRYANSIACLNGAGSARLGGYSHLLRADVDTMITPAWSRFAPAGFVCGNGAYSNDDTVRRNIMSIARSFGLTHRGVTNIGSTWYGPTSLLRRVGALTEILTKYLVNTIFGDDEGAWPGWYRGVSTLYAAEIAVNHLVEDVQKLNQLDFYSTSPASVEAHPHIHCWHTNEHFSKHRFMSGKYLPDEWSNLDLTVIRDYCLEMSFRSAEDLGLIPRRTGDR